MYAKNVFLFWGEFLSFLLFIGDMRTVLKQDHKVGAKYKRLLFIIHKGNTRKSDFFFKKKLKLCLHGYIHVDLKLFQQDITNLNKL